jgi:putative tryptophan/tyrosine transport system substrate-binding protein
MWVRRPGEGRDAATALAADFLQNSESGQDGRRLAVSSRAPKKAAPLRSEYRGGDGMRRRDLLALVGGAAALRPFIAHAQQPQMPTIGILTVSSAGADRFRRLFREDLRDLGYVEGQSVRYELRSDPTGGGQLSELAAELVRLKVDLIVTWFTPAARAAKQATRDIPIVMALAGDPVATGLVESLARPGGNVTGMAAAGAELAGKVVELIRDLLPSAHRVAVLVNVPDPFSKPFLEQVRSAGAATGQAIEPIMVHNAEELDAAFAAMAKDRPDAVLVQPSLPPKHTADLALQYRLPAVSFIRAIVDEGGLMSYGVDEADAYRHAAAILDKVLKGARPANLPVEQPTKFELVINLKTARALGLTVPPTMLVRADEVIE